MMEKITPSMNNLYCKSSENMRELNDESVDLVVTSPPYNIDVNYGNIHKNGVPIGSKGHKYPDKMQEQEYRNLLKTVFSECQRVLKPNGSIWINLKNRYEKDRIIPPFWIVDMLPKMYLKNIIIWNFDWGGSTNRRFSPRYEYIFWFTKERNNYLFNLNEVTIPSLNYRPDRFKTQQKNPTDVWYIQMVSGNYPERTSHPAQYPEELVERIIKVASKSGDLVLDPFIGSGTTAVVAKKLGRNYVGYDTSCEYIETAEKRIANITSHQIKKSKDIRDLYWYMDSDQLSEYVRTHTRR